MSGLKLNTERALLGLDHDLLVPSTPRKRSSGKTATRPADRYSPNLVSALGSYDAGWYSSRYTWRFFSASPRLPASLLAVLAVSGEPFVRGSQKSASDIYVRLCGSAIHILHASFGWPARIQACALRPTECEFPLNTSRTLLASSSGLNGFSMNAVPGLRIPILIASSSV